MKQPAWHNAFREPTPVDRPLPLWSWNSDMDEARIDTMVAQFAAQGCGGVFIHPRPGLTTEYLSPRWFELWRYTAERCAALNMSCHIYDENSYPSGFAGGHVIASDPCTLARMLRGRVLRQNENIYEPIIACVNPVTGVQLESDAWKQATPDQPVLVVHEVPFPATMWTAGYPMPDISLPQTCRAFLATTHEAYERGLGKHVGTTTTYVFTDEPTLPRMEDALPWSDELIREFAQEHGYRLEHRVGLLLVDGPGHEGVRHDYYATLNRMVCANFFRPIHDWCAKRGLVTTGHVDEHLWPEPYFLPSAAATLRWIAAPGNDLLAFAWRPDRRQPDRVAMARLNLRELDSVARQCGRERSMVETCGGGGYDYGPADMKPLEDWVMAMGVTLISPHLAHTSLVGSRKYDWPQTTSDHSAWWSDYLPHANHVARVIAALRQGTVERRVLVLMPTNSAWMHARPGLPKATWPGLPTDGPLAKLRDSMMTLIDALERGGIDYDLGDETVIAELGSIAGTTCVVGACRYRAIVVPAAMQGFEDSTLRLVESALAANIPVHSEGTQPPNYVAGRPDGRPRECASKSGWMTHADADALVAELARQFPPQLTTADGSPLPADLAWRRVETAAGPLYFCCNPWNAPVSASLRLPGHGLQMCDTATGTITTIASVCQGDSQIIDLELPPGGHVLWQCTAESVGTPPAQPTWRSLILQDPQISADHDNVLVLDHVVLQSPNDEPLAMSAPRADRKLWMSRGFEQSIWEGSIQFRRCFDDRDTRHLRGFTVAYEANIDSGVTLSGIRLAVEQPHLYRVEVNGSVVHGWEPWFDHRMKLASVGSCLKTGVNRIILHADTFHMRHEIAPAYLLGQFSLRPEAHGFAISSPHELALGTWKSLGRPLANGAMTYSWEVRLDAPARRLRVGLPAWGGATWRLSVDDHLVSRVVHGEAFIEVDYPLNAGVHRVGITVVSHLANLLGPHHHAGLAKRWSWEHEPTIPNQMAPPGAAWLAPATGLLQPPELSVSNT